MTTPLKYYNVNWVNGLKINKDHFVQQENAFKDQLRDILAISLNNTNYGLLPVRTTEHNSFEINTIIDNQNLLKIKIVECRAVTQGGARIEILRESNLPEFSVSLSNTESTSLNTDENTFYLILSIDVFGREPYGDLNSAEDPPRFPFVAPTLKINLISDKQISSNEINPNSFILGKVERINDRIKILEDYIPPCMTNMSHLKLIAFHSGVDKLLGQIEIDLIEIIRKINEKKQSTNLAASTRVLAENLLNYVSNYTLDFRWNLINQAPIKMLEIIARLARIIKNTIDCNTTSDKEEMMNYYSNWSELKPGEFEELLLNVINFKYNHHEINNSLVQFGKFIEIISALFEKLGTLAYIGKKKETGIFVKEHKSKRTFLAD